MALRSSSPYRFARCALCAAIAASFGTSVLAQTTGLAAIHGSASMSQAGSVTTITTVNGAGTAHSVLNWTSFGVPAGETVRFQQPDTASTSINRVLGGDPSSILGTLSSNGRLVLVNPAGIAVGAGAAVDTAGFTASTLGISRDNAIAGRLLFGAGDLGDFRKSGGSLQVDGTIVANNGDVVLVGPNLQAGAGAVLQASGGDVVLAAGRTVEITGRGLEGIVMQVRAPGDQAVNLGTLRGDSVAIFAGQLRHSGLIQAHSVSTAGGKVVLQATDQAETEGRIEASAGTRGGSVIVTADKLVLKSTTAIDASAPAGGGEILVGGGLDGKDARVPNAQNVTVESGVLLRADATVSGNGGTVVAWSNGDMDFRGRILARGAGGGVGGLVEVNGLGKVKFEGSVDVNGEGTSGTGTSGSNSGSGSDGSGSGSSGSGDSGSGSSGSGDSGSGDKTANSGGSDDSGRSGSGSGDSSGRSGSRSAPVPIVPLAGQSNEVRSGANRSAGETADYLEKGSTLLIPGRDDLAVLQPASTGADSDTSTSAAHRAQGKRKDRDLIVTNTQCRTGS